MNYKNIITLTTLSIITLVAIASLSVLANEVFAASVTNFKMADDIYAKVTFTFIDGVEEVYFPVFKMTSSYVGNTAAEFQLQGVVEDYPYLNEAMDAAYDYSLSAPEIMYDYKKFVVDVDLVKGGIVQKNFSYFDCSVSKSTVDTVFDNAEGYTTTKTGFAIINVIDFTCSGLNQTISEQSPDVRISYPQHQVHDYGMSSQKLSEGVHSYATFFFNDGIEKIDFPVFKLNTGFDEKSKDRPSFTVQGLVDSYTLLDRAIEKTREVRGLPISSYQKFNVDVDFANDSKIFRMLVYTDCRIEEYKVDTLSDKEEGYTGKSGFAVVEDITVTCAGLTTKNHSEIKADQKNIVSNPYMMGGLTHALVTIILDNGSEETVDFPVFKQTTTPTNVIKKSRLNPSFQVQGVISDTPVLNKVVDQIRTRGPSGSDFQGLFSADVDLIHNDKLVRTYQYEKCRVTNYDSDTVFNSEEGYVGANGFALVGVYNIECNGYHPSNPSYESMHKIEKVRTESSNDLKQTHSWRPQFIVQN